jgi:hypothetical protein
LSVNKRAERKSDTERFNFRTLNHVEVREEFQVEVSNRFAALKNSMMMMWVRIGLGKLLESLLISSLRESYVITG